MALWIVLGILVVGAIWYFGSNGTTQSAITKSTTEKCEVEPYIDNATFDQYAKGTLLGMAYYYDLEGDNVGAVPLTPGTSGTKFQVGDKMKIFSTKAGNLDQVEDFTITNCGGNKFTSYVYVGDAITLDILSQNLVAVSDAATTASTVNLSDGGTANPLNFIIRLDGASKKNTGQILLTLEFNATEVDTVSISAKSANAKVIESNPTKYSSLDLFVAEGTAPTDKFAFVVDEILDGGQADYNIKVTPESGVTMGAKGGSGFVFGNAYAGQWFIDDDGSLKFGWEDSDGTLKYEQKATDHDALIS